MPKFKFDSEDMEVVTFKPMKVKGPSKKAIARNEQIEADYEFWRNREAEYNDPADDSDCDEYLDSLEKNDA
jgi:hypothetical protein